MNSLIQLEFTALVELFQPAIAERVRISHRRKVEATDPAQFAVILLRATTEENVAFSTYAIMMAVAGHSAAPSLAAITQQTGYSYWAVRNQVDRTPWFEKRHSDLVRLSLTEAAREKLARITRRIARYV